MNLFYKYIWSTLSVSRTESMIASSSEFLIASSKKESHRYTISTQSTKSQIRKKNCKYLIRQLPPKARTFVQIWKILVILDNGRGLGAIFFFGSDSSSIHGIFQNWHQFEEFFFSFFHSKLIRPEKRKI